MRSGHHRLTLLSGGGARGFRKLGRIGMFVSCLLLSASITPTRAQTVRPVTEAETVLAVYTVNWQLLSPEPIKLVVVAWDDGRILWSQDRLHGGPPYRAARIDASRLNDLLSGYEEDGLFEIDALTRAHLGPDSEFTTMILKANGKQLEMRSWHELMESSGRSIVRKVGVVSSTSPRLRVLQDEPNDYLFYRFVWTEIRARALELIPTSGDIIDGDVIAKEGKVSWVDGEARPD